jgi:pSer/pThr/pTyr-binding forkhead associated (FHA) protein
MPTLKYYLAEGAPKLYSIHKPVTTLGKAPGNDLVISGPEVLPSHAQIAFDGRDFVIEELDKASVMAINGKKKRRTRLVHGDRLSFGPTEVVFSIFAEALKRASFDDVEAGVAITALGAHEVAGVRKLHAFSEKLMKSRDLDQLLETLLDDVIEVTNAQKGFVLLLDQELGLGRPKAEPSEGEHAEPEPRRWVVRACRNVGTAASADEAGGISSSRWWLPASR